MIPFMIRRDMMKRFVEGADRGQSTLLPECLDDWIDESNPVRVIDAFVDALDLAELGFDGVEPAATGRPCLSSLGSAEALHLRLSQPRAVEPAAGARGRPQCRVMWLLGRLVPDHKTIADFRKDNGPAIRKVCARFVELCREMGLLATASVAIDGSKFKAVNNRDKNFTRGKVERRRAQLEESVARYLSQLDTADRQEPTEALAVKTTRLKEKLDEARQRRWSKLAAYEKQMLASPDQQISLTDPDSRSMATSGRGSGVVGYNVQVGGRHRAPSDRGARGDEHRLGSLATCDAWRKAAKAVLQVDNSRPSPTAATSTARRSWPASRPASRVTLPKPMTSGAKSEGRFGKQDFVYLPEEDVYRCPAGEQLTYCYCQRGGRAKSCAATGRMRVKTCRNQASVHHRPRSAGSRDGSTSTCSRPCSSGSMQNPKPCASGARRSSIPSARIKARMGATHFLMKTLPKVAAEMALHVLAYNLTRVMNIVGIKPLMAAIRA